MCSNNMLGTNHTAVLIFYESTDDVDDPVQAQICP